MNNEFDLNKIELCEILKEKGITHLYHANTVSTSITFLNNSNLLSREFVERNGLFQTSQFTDSKDKKYGIYDDIFLDFIDIHNIWKKHNFYGPFLFVLDVEILKSDLIKTLRITKKNPSNWLETESEKDWYYSDLTEFEGEYNKANKRKNIGSMIILKDIDGKLPLRPYLKKFIFDNPNLTLNINGEKKYLATLLSSRLYEIVNENGFSDVERVLRHKHSIFQCRCWIEYNAMQMFRFKNLKRLFHPNP